MSHPGYPALLGVILGVLSAPAAHACGCWYDQPWEDVRESEVVFLGQLVKTEWVHIVEGAPWVTLPSRVVPARRSNGVALVFEVERWWRGPSHRRVRVLTGFTSCDIPTPVVGETMLIVGGRHGGAIFTSLCERSLPVYHEGNATAIASFPDFPREHGHEWLLTRDSLTVHLGSGREPSGVPWRGVVALGMLVLGGLLVWTQRRRAA